jgi:hypothetical protein
MQRTMLTEQKINNDINKNDEFSSFKQLRCRRLGDLKV